MRNERFETFHTDARDLSDALSIFGTQLNEKLAISGDGIPKYMLDEWEESPHWVNYHIPVFLVHA